MSGQMQSIYFLVTFWDDKNDRYARFKHYLPYADSVQDAENRLYAQMRESAFNYYANMGLDISTVSIRAVYWYEDNGTRLIDNCPEKFEYMFKSEISKPQNSSGSSGQNIDSDSNNKKQIPLWIKILFFVYIVYLFSL